MTHAAPARELAAIPADYALKIHAAVDNGDAMDAFVQSAADAGITNVFLVGCGGSLFSFGPLRTILDRSPVPVLAFNSDELVLRRPAALGPGSFVVTSSTRGETAETARAAAAARAAGAVVVGVTQDPNSVVAAECEQVLHEGMEAKQVLLAQIGWSLLRAWRRSRLRPGTQGARRGAAGLAHLYARQRQQARRDRTGAARRAHHLRPRIRPTGIRGADDARVGQPQEQLRRLHEAYIRNVNSAIARGRPDIARELADEYADEALRLMTEACGPERQG